MKAVLDAWREKALNQPRTILVGKIDQLWAQRYAVAIDDLNPLYFDLEAAAAAGHPTLIAPPNYITTLRDEQQPGPVEAELLPDGTRRDTRPEVPGLVVMGGGQEITFHAPVYCGEAILAEKETVDIGTREGRSGEMIVVVEEVRYRNDAGERKVTLRNTALYRLIEDHNDHT